MSEPTEDEGTQAGTTPADDARRRFREALDKKKFAHHAGRAGGGPQAQHPHSAPAKPQKTFRRKSG